MVWNTSDEWVYLLTPLNTVLPTVGFFNNDVLLGSRAAVGPYIARHRPTIIVVNLPTLVLRPTILPVLARYYVAAYRIGLDTVYVERPPLHTASSAPRHDGARTPAAQPPERS